MAATVSEVKSGVPGDLRYKVIDFTADGSYAAGGYAFQPFAMETLYCEGNKNGGFVPSYDYTNKKLQFFKTGSVVSTALLEAGTNEAGLSTKVFRLFLYGR